MTVNPGATMRLVAAHLPSDLHEHVLLVGSLAVAYHYRELLPQEVTTKDADVIIQPAGALTTCHDIAMRLRGLGWVHRPAPDRPPGKRADAPNLPVVRLHPPSIQAYFVELLAMPASTQSEAVYWHRLQLVDEWYVVPSFRFMKLLRLHQEPGEQGLRYAAPSMMALANALSHPEVGEQEMSGTIENRAIRRSAKDLGRVLGIARLEKRELLEAWPELWLEALRAEFPDEWPELAQRACTGLRELARHAEALDQAHHTLTFGLLAGVPLTLDNLRAIGEQFEADVLEPLEALAKSKAQGDTRPRRQRAERAPAIVDNGLGMIALHAPYREELPSAAKKLGGKWNGVAWVFHARDEQRVRALVRDIFGSDPI